MSKPITPVIFEYSLGVDQLKSLTLERLAVADGTAGQCHFPAELEDRYVDQFLARISLTASGCAPGRMNSSTCTDTPKRRGSC